MRVLGLEPSTYGLKGRCEDSQVLDSQALSEHTPGKRTKKRTKDIELTAIIEAWPTLPEAVQAGIAAMVRATKGAIDETTVTKRR